MARDIFEMTVTQPDATGVMKALSGIKATVYVRNTTTPVNVFRASDGTTQGPIVEAGASGGPNPFITGASGEIAFWADGPAEIDVLLEDTVAPPRIPSRRIGFNAIGAAAGSFPTAMLAGDASIALASMAADVLRQVAQIGEVIDWWRPNDSVPIPTGFVLCDGRQVPAGQHDFAGLSQQAINVPDLRNMFILGAVPATAGEAAAAQGPVNKAYGTGAGQGDTAAVAPGIGGTGGSNAAKNFAHGHGVPGVSHTHTTADHLHGVGSLYTGNHAHTVGGAYVSQHNRVFGPAYGGGEAAAFANSVSQCYGQTDAVGSIGIGGTTGAADRALTTTGPSVSLNTATNSTTWTLDPGTDVRPRFYGLLKLMKVRRS